MILVLDNYDSFTYNLVQFLGELGANPVVYRNDALSVAEALALEPESIVISPGPGEPADAGISIPLIRAVAGRVPLLGVCLGHQGIGEAFGGRVVRAGRLMHGTNPLTVMRYHSLVVAAEDFPPDLEMTAWAMDRPRGQEIMALRHRVHPLFGVQFHPESIATESGKTLLQNFLQLAGAFRASRSAVVA